MATTTFQYNGHTYLLSNTGTWQEAQNEAQSLGGNLVTINDQGEQNWLVSTFLGNEHLWIGYTDQETEGVFKWVSGENLTYTNWSNGNPDDANGNEDYVHLWSNGLLSGAQWWPQRGEWNDVRNNENAQDLNFSSNGKMQGIIEISNNLPTGNITITGKPLQGQTLVANTSALADADGLGSLHYAWKAGGASVGTDSNIYAVTAADVNKSISVIVSYTDGKGTVEQLSSAPTPPVTEKGTETGTEVIFKLDPHATSDVIPTQQTGEDGSHVIYNVSLSVQPLRDVSISFSSSNSNEGKIDAGANMTFNNSNWNIAQNLVVTGVDDKADDGDVSYQIKAVVQSIDVNYKLLSVAPLKLSNTDNDAPLPPTETYGDSGGSKSDLIAGTDAADTIYGLNMADDLSGGLGNDVLWGGYGLDNLFGEDGNDLLQGEQDADYMEGGNGNDTLDGGLGADTMIGGAGDDTYILGYDAKDSIQDKGLPSDVDTIIMPYQIKNYTLADGIENGMIAAGTQASNLIGNASNNGLTGNDGSNKLDGGIGNDTLAGGGGNDGLLGGSGADKLTADAGNDSLDGGAAADALNGGGGNDLLNGGVGNDTLTGGAGQDVFKFALPMTANVDKITDFNVSDDSVQLENSVFTSLTATGGLVATAFTVGTAAKDSTDKIIYNPDTGAVYYDGDGNGTHAAVPVAILGTDLSLTSSDFVVI